MKHVYLSPHLDDAVLSCGGAIHAQAARGEAVVAITLLAGEPARHHAPAPLSPFALLQHNNWGNPPEVVALRRAEDVAALTRLGAQWYQMGYLDAIYRTDAAGRWLYADEEAIFGPLQPGDLLAQARRELTAEIAGFLGESEPATLYAPLALGHHVDHQLVHAAARPLLERGYRLAFYEDYPYAAWPGAFDTGLQAAGAANWRSELLCLDPADVTAWVGAIGYYRTQLGTLFRGAEAMPSAVWSFAASHSPEAALAQRIWWPER